MISDKYIHSKVEDKIYSYWEKNKLFKPQKNSKKFSIVIPPPNVTGSLHMGHALNNSIQDFLVRYYRMNNYETLWQPGTDHAGIATQALVEKKLEKESLTKATLGREKFIEKVWEWKNEYGDIIINQLKKLGCSCDWSRNAFTMDKNLSKSVLKVFVELHKKKLIYKAEKLVNWDTVLKTAISDLEVDQREMNSKIYYIRYPLENSSEFITIATTRPETMLGDTAIAVNPKDKRYKKFVGKIVTIPIVGRKIKIIKDNYADPDQGTGALKITPAHDFNDYDVGQRNKLDINLEDLNSSQPEILMKSLDLHKGWSVLVCLVGGGQEINKGEGGMEEWLKALRDNFPDWKVWISNALDSKYYLPSFNLDQLQGRLFRRDNLHLSISIRSFRSEKVAKYISNLLEGNISETYNIGANNEYTNFCLLYTSPSPREYF